MALNAVDREANIRDSIKKFCIDNIETTSGIKVTFDKALSVPNIQGKDVTRWVSVHIGDISPGIMTDIVLNLYCCTRQDNEGFRLSQVCDTVVGYFSGDPDGSDGTKRIDLYQSNVSPWVKLGGMVVQDIRKSADLFAEDETKFKVVTVRIRTASKV